MRTRRVRTSALLAVLALLLLPNIPALAIAPGDAAFQRTWQRTDNPVATGNAGRTWMWGPAAFTPVMHEPYEQAPGGTRAVQYFDKSRMEITNPGGDPDSIWYVTNGLLVREMVLGQIQTGDNNWIPAEPAEVNVAGDSSDPDGPTYKTIGMLLDASAPEPGSVITGRVNRDGQVIDDPSLASYEVLAGEPVAETGHGVASVFLEFLRSEGTIFENGQLRTDRIFPNTFYVDVLLQCFERRCLTYTPGNPEGWRVEAGNVGQHYYTWRHGEIETPETGDIRVVSIFYDPDVPNDRSGEYVAIRSFDPYPVNMTGWVLTDDAPTSYTFPEFILRPGATVYVYNCTGVNTPEFLFTGRCTAWWNNTHDTAYLYDAGGTLVSTFGY
jgi:hypothetical protein